MPKCSDCKTDIPWKEFDFLRRRCPECRRNCKVKSDIESEDLESRVERYCRQRGLSNEALKSDSTTMDLDHFCRAVAMVDTSSAQPQDRCRWCDSFGFYKCQHCRFYVCWVHFVVLRVSFHGPGPVQNWNEKCCRGCALHEKWSAMVMAFSTAAGAIGLVPIVHPFGKEVPTPLATILYFATLICAGCWMFIPISVLAIPTRSPLTSRLLLPGAILAPWLVSVLLLTIAKQLGMTLAIP